ncbi:NifU-like protein [Tieghemostelium lacteum]|uniref:Iron-sulfur cluster assembly protein n=1 Tax=Tieghemostelium lacteum TaxID=361077 RepID=A0A151ZFM5_TIELA|nr:NifU-like protein [Tieghemostelium lacteum]|eukprot:KYQ92768.1 NifU-like protein [Tieghemostelium lacteum]
MNYITKSILRSSRYLVNNNNINNISLVNKSSLLQSQTQLFNNSNIVNLNKRFYHERVLDHYNNPRNVGSFDKKALDVGTATVGAPACGDVMKIQIKVKDNIVVDVCFKTFGCGSAIASSSLATEWVKGKTLDQCLEIRNTDIAKHLSLPPVKMHCSMLAEQAIKRAIYDYKVKLEKQQIQPTEEKLIETTL